MTHPAKTSSRKQILVILGLLAEQAAISFPSFVYFPFMARVLNQPDFATLALGFTIYLVCISLYDAAVGDPISIIDHATPADESLHIRLVWTLTAALIGALLVCAPPLYAVGGLWPKSIALALLLLAGAIGIVILRRVIHRARLTHVSAAAAGGYFVAFTLISLTLYGLDALSPLTAVAPFLGGSVAFLSISARLMPRLLNRLPPISLVRDHGRVASGSTVFALFGNLTMNIYPPVFALLGDQRAIAAFRLISSTFTPFVQVSAALNGFLLPQIGRATALPRIYGLAVLGSILLPLIALAISLKWGTTIATLAFGDQYADLGQVMPIAFLGISLAIALAAANLLVRARQYLMTLRLSGVIQFAVTAILASFMVGRWGLSGAFTTYALANVAALAITAVSLAYWNRGKPAGSGGPS